MRAFLDRFDRFLDRFCGLEETNEITGRGSFFDRFDRFDRFFSHTHMKVTKYSGQTEKSQNLSNLSKPVKAVEFSS